MINQESTPPPNGYWINNRVSQSGSEWVRYSKCSGGGHWSLQLLHSLTAVDFLAVDGDFDTFELVLFRWQQQEYWSKAYKNRLYSLPQFHFSSLFSFGLFLFAHFPHCPLSKVFQSLWLCERINLNLTVSLTQSDSVGVSLKSHLLRDHRTFGQWPFRVSLTDHSK